MATESLEQQHLALRAPPRGANVSVLGVIPQKGEWLVAYALMRLGKGDGATICDVCRVSDLGGPQRKRAELWMSAFSRFVEASSPA